MTTPGVTPGADEGHYRPGDTVWVKLDRWPWWPARVIPEDLCEDLIKANRRPAACVQFPIEDNYEVIYDKGRVRSWTEANNAELIKKTWGQVKTKPPRVLKLLKDVLSLLETEYHETIPSLPEATPRPVNPADRLGGKPDRSPPSVTSPRGTTPKRGSDSVTSEPRPPKSEMAKCLSLLPKKLLSSPGSGSDSEPGAPVSIKPTEVCQRLSQDLLNGNTGRGHGGLGEAARNGSIEGRSMDWSLTDWLLSDQRRRSLGDEPQQEPNKDETMKKVTPPTNHSRQKKRAHSSPGLGTRPKTQRRLEDTFPNRTLQWDPNIDEDCCDPSSAQSQPERCGSPALVPLPLSQPEPAKGDTADTSMSDDDSDEDLPDVLSSATKDPIKKGTLLWVQYRRYPFWPAIVRNCYLRKKTLQKVSFVFIGDGIYSHEAKGRPLTMRYNRKKMVPFAVDNEKHAQFKEEGLQSQFSELFKETVTRVEDFLVKKCLNVTNCPFSFFAEDLHAEKWNSEVAGQLNDQDDDLSSCSEMAESEGKPASGAEEPSGDECEVVEEDLEVTGEELSKQIVNIKARREKKGERLLSIIKTERIKNYLLDIYHERRPSDRHKAFKAEESRNKMLSSSGFGPIDDEEQQMQLVQLLGQYYRAASGENLPNMAYIFHVWLPEAIIEATHRILKKTRAFAEERYLKGPFRLKQEKQLEHAAMIESGKNIDPEDAERYRKKLDGLRSKMFEKLGGGGGFLPTAGSTCS